MLSFIYIIGDRLNLFRNTINSIRSYTEDIRDDFEILTLAHENNKEMEEYIISLKDEFDIKYVLHDFPDPNKRSNPAYAYNLGCNLSKYDSIVISSPEVRHKTEVIKQLMKLVGQNIIAKSVELNKDGSFRRINMGSTVPTRRDDPGMYFLAMYNKDDFISIGGIDEAFMSQPGWEDRDFGRRFKAKGIPFKVLDEIVTEHQYHPRAANQKFIENNKLMKKNQRENIIVVNSNGFGNTNFIRKII